VTPAQREMLAFVEDANFKGSRPRLQAGKDRAALKAAGFIKSSPPNAGRFTARSGKGWGWSITEAGNAALSKATIPATGHAATVDPDDLRPWGYAPGEYVFRCTDCASCNVALSQSLGDKRSWRCRPHAVLARDASGHAATEGEGANDGL